MEDQLGVSRSMGDLRLSADTRRRAEMSNGIGGPEHSGTFPPESAGSDHVAPDAGSPYQNTAGSFNSPGTPNVGAGAGAGAEPEPSMRSQDPIYVSSSRGLDLDEGNAVEGAKPRSRFLGKFKRQKKDVADVEDLKDGDEVEGPKFTFASQVRATVFNSWINVLIFAAPAGSMLPPLE